MTESLPSWWNGFVAGICFGAVAFVLIAEFMRWLLGAKGRR